MTRPFGCRHAAVVFCFALTVVSPASAFDFPIHIEITRAGLTAVVDSFVRSLTGQPLVRESLSRAAGTRVMTFTPKAVQEITDANKAQDTDDCADKDNPSIPARPCAVIQGRIGERASAFAHLFNEPAWEHFDAGEIQQSSDFVLATRRKILDLMKRGQFVGARKQLGHALHAIQDFYSHSNYVELGYRSPDIERRIGLHADSFLVEGTRPRLAGEKEPTCLDGQYLFTNDLKTTLMEELKNTSATDFERRRRILEAINYLTRMLQNPDNLALTSGHFTLSQTLADPESISGAGKCRHGFETGIDQPGIHKDVEGRPYHGEARTLATVHSTRFIVDIMGSILSDPELESDEKFPCIVGLLGYEPTTIMTSLSVGIPGAPNDASWDTALGSALGFFVLGTRGLKNIQPDILVCMESANVPALCVPLCDDADWSIDLNAYVCTQPVSVNGWGTLVEPDLRVLVREVDLGEPRRVIANFRVEDPRACDPFCSLELEPGRTVWIRFDLKPVTEYGGPRRARRAVLPPADGVSVAGPGASNRVPPAPTPPPSTSRSTAPGSPGGSSPPASPTPISRAGAAPLRTREGIDVSLALRDSDNCVGADAFFPQPATAGVPGSQPGPVPAEQLYHLAAFSLAISDPTAKKLVLDGIRARAGNDAFFAVMTAVIADPVHSQRLVTAYQNTARNVVQQIASNGLTSLLPTPKPVSALLPDVDRWILGRLSSPAAVAGAIDLMSTGARPLTAECTLNELAKQGFTATVLP